MQDTGRSFAGSNSLPARSCVAENLSMASGRHRATLPQCSHQSGCRSSSSRSDPPRRPGRAQPFRDPSSPPHPGGERAGTRRRLHLYRRRDRRALQAFGARAPINVNASPVPRARSHTPAHACFELLSMLTFTFRDCTGQLHRIRSSFSSAHFKPGAAHNFGAFLSLKLGVGPILVCAGRTFDRARARLCCVRACASFCPRAKHGVRRRWRLCVLCLMR